MKEWMTYFKALLGGVEKRVKVEGRKEVVGDKEEGNGIRREEVNDAIARMKRNKATGEDDMTGLVVPLIKQGEDVKVEEYRGITLMPVGDKIYAEVLRGKLEKQLEEKGSIPHNQTGFRKGMGTIDNICTLNYQVNRNLGRKKGKLIALFVDFKAAFDSVNRTVFLEGNERGETMKG